MNQQDTQGTRRPGMTASANWIELLIGSYGPIAFGVISLLVIWLMIINPWLEQNRLDWSRLNDITETQAETARTLSTSAQTLRAAANTLDRVADKLEGARR